MWDFTVPRGSAVWLAISSWVSPRKKARATICRGRGSEAARARCRLRWARVATSRSCGSRPSPPMRRFRRPGARLTPAPELVQGWLRARVRSQPSGRPRAGSKRAAWRQTWKKPSSVASSAFSALRRMRRAMPYTRPAVARYRASRALSSRRAMRPSDPEHPGLVQIYKGPDSRKEQYENAYHCDTTWRECPQMGAVLRCTEAPDVGGDMIWVNMVDAYSNLPDDIKAQIADLRARHSIEASL